MCIWIIHSYFKKYPQENPLAVQWLRLQVSNAGVWVGTKIMQPKKKTEIPNINSVTEIKKIVLTLKKS